MLKLSHGEIIVTMFSIITMRNKIVTMLTTITIYKPRSFQLLQNDIVKHTDYTKESYHNHYHSLENKTIYNPR